MRTHVAKGREAESLTVGENWFVVDAEDQVLGRLATRIARILIGKDKANFTPHLDCGDHVVVINADRVKLTGNKLDQKVYRRHSGYPGGIYSTNFAKLHARHPDRVLKLAVKGMLPKGPLGYAMLRKMKVYAGAAHPHAAQQPKNLEVQ